MTINLTKFSLTILAALTLTACGSGGGSSASNAPIDRTSTPASQPRTPAAKPSAPAVQPNTPAAQPTTPATQPSTPAVQPSTPAAQPSTPAAQPSTPAAQPSTPAAQLSTPAAQPSTPAAQLSTPAAQPSTPATQPSTPATQPSTPAVQPSTPAAQPSEQAVLEMPERSPTNTGLVFSIKTESEEDNVGQINTINNEQELSNRTLTSIDVDGKNIPIDFKFELNEDWTKEGEFIEERNLSPHICCRKYTHVRFGAIANHSYGQNDILFYNGIPSENVPKSGKVSYKGESIMADKGNAIFGSYRRGTSEFTVDFGKKELSGSLNAENRRYNTEINEYDAPKNVKVEIDAKISDNRFYGTAKSSTFVSEGITEGKFYGDGAKELGGMVKAKDNSWAGAYSAKAQ